MDDIDGDPRPITAEAVSTTGFRSVYSMVMLRRSFVCVTGIPPGGLLEVSVRGGEGRRLWAFVSLTNNETEQVTTYTPQ